MFIEVKKYGDFDGLYTCCILEGGEHDINDLLVAFKVKNNLDCNVSKNGLSGLQQRETGKITDKWITFLKGNGFKSIKTKKVAFSD